MVIPDVGFFVKEELQAVLIAEAVPNEYGVYQLACRKEANVVAGVFGQSEGVDQFGGLILLGFQTEGEDLKAVGADHRFDVVHIAEGSEREVLEIEF